ncbi:unnamed protein product, partial [marine sediment metagenome]
DVTDTYTGIATVTGATHVTLLINARIVFKGIVNSVDRDYLKHIYRVNCSSELELLRNFQVNYDTLHTALTGAASYAADDGSGYPSVLLSEVIEEMFDVAGMSDEVHFETLLIVKSKTVYELNGIDTDTRDFYFSDIRVDENMLYGINSPVAGNHTALDQDYAHTNISFLEFLQYVCSMVGYSISFRSYILSDWIFTGYTNGTATDIDYPAYSIGDDDIYSKGNKSGTTTNDVYWRNEWWSKARVDYSTLNQYDLDSIINEGRIQA